MSTFSFGIYHEQAVPESELHPYTDNLSDMSLKDLEQDSVFAYPSKTSKTSKLAAVAAARSTKETSLYSMSSKGTTNAPVSTRQKPAGSSRRHSHESLKDFMEEGGGEAASGMDVGNLLYAKLAEVDGDEQDAVMDRVQEFSEEGLPSRGGSLSTIIGSDVDIRASFNNHNYVDNNWGGVGFAGPQTQQQQQNSGGCGVNNIRHKPDSKTTKCKTKIKPKSDNTVVPTDNIRHTTSSGGDSSRRVVGATVASPHLSGGGPNLNKDKSGKKHEEMIGLLNTSTTFTPRDGVASNFSTSVLSPLVGFRSASTDSINRGGDSYGGGGSGDMFDMGVLHRNGSVGSQLSRITLSDINVSDEELEL